MTGLATSVNLTTNYEFRLARTEDLPRIIELLPELGGDSFSERFPDKTCADLVHWKYFQNPDGDAAVGVALDGSHVVSIVAGVPQQVRLEGKEYIVKEGDVILFRHSG